MSSPFKPARPGRRRTLLAVAAGAAPRAGALGVRADQGRDPHRPRLQQDRPARGLRQADADRPDDGPRLRDQRHDDGRRQEDRRDREGRPGQARRRQEPARRPPTATTRPTSRSARRPRAWRWRCCRSPRSTRRSCWSSRRSPTRSPATSGTSTSSAPAATARRTRSRTRSRSTRTGVSIATLAQDYAFGRDGVKAFKDALKKAKIVHEEYLPPNTTDFTAGGAAPDRRAEGQAGPQGDLHHLGRRRQPVQDRRPRPEALRHRDRDRRQHPAGDGRVQAVPGHGRRGLLLLRHAEEPGQRVAGRQPLQAVQDAARFLHRRRHERRRSRSSRR